MAEVTARLARPIGFDSFAHLEVEPTSIKTNPDGTLTVALPDDTDAATLALVRERMSTRDDTEAQAQRALAALLATVEATQPANDNIATLRNAVLALGRLVLPDSL